jgi:GH24 family phage-related lysozyme (muramidase)
MDYRELTEEQYYARIRTVVVGAEGLHARSQDVGDGMATIGYGYTFNRNNNAEIWRNAGITLTRQESEALAAIDAAPSADKTRLALAFPRALDAAESDQLLRASVREYEGPANALNMPLSDERVAMVSLTYNRGAGALMGDPARNVPEHPVMGAIRDGDRAEAWFQMRYNCWGSAGEQFEGGLRKRRFAESQVFGLYDDPANVTPEEARGVARMYQLHRDEIGSVESRHGVTAEGEQATRNRIADANRDYPALVRDYGRVQTIAEALGPAHETLLRQARTDHPDIADRLTTANIPVGRIHTDPDRELRTNAEVDQDAETMRNQRNPPRAGTIVAISREQRNSTTQDEDPDHAATIDSRRMTRGNNPREVDSNDLLIGNGGDDTLRAHRGNDVLIGGSGRDRMEGGIGHDTYVANAGDTVMDNDGRGELRWRNERGRDELLNGGVRNEGDPANTYRSANGQFTYVVDGSNLTVTNMQGESLRVENYARGDMGIRLQDAPTREGRATPDAPPTQETNAQAIERLSPQDRALFDQMRSAVQRNGGGYTEEQTQNIAAAGLAEYRRRESQVLEPQQIAVYGDRLFTSYFPNGTGREPNFHANVRLEDAANVPARESVQQVEVQRQQTIAAPVQEREQVQEAPRQR